MFRFKLSPQPRTSYGSTSSPRTSVLPTFDCQSAIAKVLSQERQPLTISARNASVKRRLEVFRGFPLVLLRPARPLTSAPHSPVHYVNRPRTSPLIRFSAGLDSTHALRPKQPLFGGIFGEPGTTPRDWLSLSFSLPPAHGTIEIAHAVVRTETPNPAPGSHHVTFNQKNRPAIVRRPHGPCRNRTYNLAIKSRLLCQLS